MDTEHVESISSEQSGSSFGANRVAIVAIVTTAIVFLACIAACTTASIAFLMNAPWK